MFVILVYDVNQKRVARILQIARKYLFWVQNSVLEGEITEAAYKKLKLELSRAINKEEDSVVSYVLGSTRYTSRETLGREKGGEATIL